MLDKTWSDRCSDLARAVDRLSDIGCQDALILLKSSFSATYSVTPSVSHTALQTFDSLLRDFLTHNQFKFIGHSLASFKGGGLGVRRVCMSSLAIPAFLASAASSLSIQADILAGFASPDDSNFQEYLTIRF